MLGCLKWGDIFVVVAVVLNNKTVVIQYSYFKTYQQSFINKLKAIKSGGLRESVGLLK